MKNKYRYYLSKLLGFANYFPAIMTNKEELQSLLENLYPLATDKELIRLGPTGDGGYLVPNDLMGIQACFSPGVNLISGFEKDCADLGMKVFLADKSVEQPAMEHASFHFTKMFVGSYSDNDFITFDEWVGSVLAEKESELLLQIDIEGFEYEVFISMSEDLMYRARIIVVEFHHLDQLWNKPFFNIVKRAFYKILKTHSCVHIHPNNSAASLKIDTIHIPTIMEFTFLRNDRIKKKSFQQDFPNSLDCNNSLNETLTLPSCWFKKK